MCNDALGVDVLVQPHDRCVAGQAWFNQLILNGVMVTQSSIIV